MTEAPAADLQISFWMNEGVPYYNVVLDGTALLEDAPLGLETTVGSFQSDLSVVSKETSSGDSTWNTVVGDKAVIEDRYNQTAVTLSNAEGKTVTVELRAYDTGAALRYILPEQETDYRITGEYTQFAFPAGAVAQIHEDRNQTVPQTVPVESFAGKHYCRPMTVEYEHGAVVSICEANLDDYAVMYMTKSADRTLRAMYDGGSVGVAANVQKSSPWRVFVVAEELASLPGNEDIILNLNEPADEDMYKFSEWVKPGRNLMLGAGSETTESLKSWIDTAKAENFEYVLLDYGWYGPELDDRCDPRLDPSKLEPEKGDSEELVAVKETMKQFITADSYFDAGEGFPPYGLITGEPVPGWPTGGKFAPKLNMREICAYANSQGVGMILYVNNRHMFDKYGRYTVDELFARFEDWGAAGVKPGFMNEGEQAYEKRNEEMIQAAARHHLVMTIHDEYVTSGIERTYPNMLSTEGILGDEGIKGDQIAQDISTLFTRAIQGPTDHTFCYPGKATKGYALASSLLFRSYMHSLYWYGNPSSVGGLPENEKQFWKDLPSNWDDLKVLEAGMSEYATFARKTRGLDEWFVGSISAIDREARIPLSFLTPGQTYVAELYADAVGLTGTSSNKNSSPLECVSYRIDSTETMYRPMAYGTGYAVRLRPATADDAELPVYKGGLERLRNTLKSIEGLKESDYTAATWQKLADAIAAANALLEEGNPTDAQVQAAVEALLQAEDGLRSVNVLSEQLNQAKCLPEGHYTPESWAPLAEAVATAKELLASLEEVTQAQLDEAAELVKNALAGLVKRPVELASTVYLSDLDYEPNSSSSWGPIQKDRSHENPKLELIVNGARTVFPKGLGVHANADVYYNLEGTDYEIFEAYVGVDALKDNMGDVIFRVYSDDVLIYESQPSGTGAREAQKISVPVANTKILHLQADTNGPDNGDHADWADAKLLTMKEIDPASTITGIAVDGKVLQEFDPGVYVYQYPIQAGDPVPEVTVQSDNDAVSYQVYRAASVPGITMIPVTRPDGSEVVYQVRFSTTSPVYVSDLDWTSMDNQGGYGHAVKDSGVEGLGMQVTGPDGEALALPEVNGKRKGIGMHAYCMITYDIAGKGYGRFESWVGASHLKEYFNSMIFKVYCDQEEEPRFTSAAMTYGMPAEFVSVDLTGVRTLKLMLDPNGSINGDHGNWADAKFLCYDEVQTEFAIDAEVTGGTADVSVAETGTAGERMIVSVANVEAGKILESITVTDTAGNAIDTKEITAGGEYSFLMPANDATVQVALRDAKSYLLNVQYGSNAVLSAEGTGDVILDGNGLYAAKALENGEITLTFTPANGPFASAKLNGENIPFETDGCTYTFTMPDENTVLRFAFTYVNKDILETLLEKANEVTDEQLAGLVESVSKRFIAARNNAKAVYEDDSATQEEVNEAWKELLDAMHYLSFEAGTKEQLEYWLDYAAMLDLNNFTPKSLEGYAEALAYAEEIYNDEGETLKAEVEKAANNLHDAIMRLEFKADTETLALFVKQAQEIDLDEYLDGPEKDAFEEVLPQAEALLADGNATQKQVDAMTDKLFDALAGLRVTPDREALKDLLEESEALDPADYTEASYAILRAALNLAWDTCNDENATPKDIAVRYATVEKARAGLALADKPEEPEKPDNKPSHKPSNSGGKKPVGNTSGTGTAVAVPNPLINAVQNVMGQKSVRSDTTVAFTLKRGNAYCFKMTVVNGSSAAPNFTVGNGSVLKTQFVAKIGNDYYYRVWATGTPGQSTGVYTTMVGEAPQQHCVVTIG
ncbi:NPCBM/NEW2 domain-containing protein [Anaeromassilibacillus senegalensis]|uniref:NPCBM/NEW2 domain-containing protein n=1 Tax=Anaeromassilibacillus senegalensis TaxID=1673717 RepID=UPI0006831EC9|nr:NPCBM/NEW2 domain-containing protein [Anaeromassilibacillus senegalensis]